MIPRHRAPGLQQQTSEVLVWDRNVNFNEKDFRSLLTLQTKTVKAQQL